MDRIREISGKSSFSSSTLSPARRRTLRPPRVRSHGVPPRPLWYDCSIERGDVISLTNESRLQKSDLEAARGSY